MTDDMEKDTLDDVIGRIEAGAKAGGARPYLLDYLKVAKENVFKKLVASPPSHDALLRVWGFAAGLDAIEQDLAETIREGVEAREMLKRDSAEAETPQAGG